MGAVRIALLGLLFRVVYAGYCTEAYNCIQTCSKLVGIYSSCGFFGWSRCHNGNRRVYSYCLGTCDREFCCSGYTGSNCSTDLDECSLGTSDCAHQCENSEGSYNCSCNAGFELAIDGVNCEDIDECTNSSHNDCEQDCRNTAGSYSCTCRAGYVQSHDQKTCLDVNECQTNNGGCDQVCNNIVGSYTCSCRNGYELNQQTCSDMDECSLGTSDCAHLCKNTEGSYICSCNSGYELGVDRVNCDDIDECANSSHHGCQQDCRNTVGSYYCTCRAGFVQSQDKKTCIDINECTKRNGDCDHICVNEPGFHRCECNSGYRMLDNNSRDSACTDIDECSESSAKCSQMCSNTNGSYECSCKAGYLLDTDGYACLDKNDCENIVCQNEGSCVDGVNFYTCVCKVGFHGQQCGTDIDECASSSHHDCQQDCRNTVGSYYCTCRAGYVQSQDQKNCIVDCFHPGNIHNGRVSVTVTYYGGTATYNCNSDYGLSGGDNVRHCQRNATWSGSEPTCIFANHCKSSPCKNGGTCWNRLGAYHCECSNGWSGQNCEKDIQPPVMTGCSNDIQVYAKDRYVRYNWTEPSFSDPMNTTLDIVMNYQDPDFTFPWGNFTVQYVATKTSNGLQAECTFKIKVRPTPCKELHVPLNGALLCNGWKKDYGRLCMVVCQQNYTISPAYRYYTWYVCGASGNWIAASPVPDCEVPVVSMNDALFYQPEYSEFTFSSPCQDDVTQLTLQGLYLDHLKKTNGFSSFCSDYEDECIRQNVEVKCSG